MSNLGQHDGDGIRYAMHLSAPKGGSAQMLRDPSGGWVSWEDYARLKAEVERLTKGHSTDFVRAEMYRHLLDENAKLKEEVMRMRNDDYKEGDILQKCCEHQKNRIERLKAEVERLTELNSTLALRYDATKSMLDGCAKEIEEMEAEVERLTKAGDSIISILCQYVPRTGAKYALMEWRAAKEGKQS